MERWIQVLLNVVDNLLRRAKRPQPKGGRALCPPRTATRCPSQNIHAKTCIFTGKRLKHPDTPLEKCSLIIPGCLFFLWVYARTGSAFGTPHSGGFRGIFTAVLGLALVLAAMTAVSLYFPKVGFWLWVGVPVVVSLMIIMPLICLIQRAGFMAAFMTWLISVAALAALILLISAGFDAVSSGRGQTEKSKVHKQEIEQLIGVRR